MATSALVLTNGKLVMTPITASELPIYEYSLLVVQSGAGTGEINVADAASGVNITLPAGGTYSGPTNGKELEVYFNGSRVSMDQALDYNCVSTTQIALTFDTVVGDRLRFRKDRGA
jgi:hypothetical protein